MKLFEAIRLSKIRQAVLDRDAPEALVRPAFAYATEDGIEFLSVASEHQKMIWSVARINPEAALLYRSESWEPIEPMTGLEVLAGIR